MISSSTHNSANPLASVSASSAGIGSSMTSSGGINSSVTGSIAGNASGAPFIYTPGRGHPNFNPTKPVVNISRSESTSRTKSKSDKSSKNRKKLTSLKEDKNAYSHGGPHQQHHHYDYPYHQYGYYPEDELCASGAEDESGATSQKQMSASRYYRNNLLIAEVFSDKVMPDVRSVVTNTRLEVLRRQADSLIVHQERSLNELATMEQNFKEKKRRILEASEEFTRQLEHFSRPVPDAETYQKMFENALQQIRQQHEEGAKVQPTSDHPHHNPKHQSVQPQSQPQHSVSQAQVDSKLKAGSSESKSQSHNVCNSIEPPVSAPQSVLTPVSGSAVTPVTSFSSVSTTGSVVYHKMGQGSGPSHGSSSAYHHSTPSSTVPSNINSSSSSITSTSSNITNNHHSVSSGPGANYHSLTSSTHSSYHSSYSHHHHHHQSHPSSGSVSIGEFNNFGPMGSKMTAASSYPHHPPPPHHHQQQQSHHPHSHHPQQPPPPPQHHHHPTVEMNYNLRNALNGPPIPTPPGTPGMVTSSASSAHHQHHPPYHHYGPNMAGYPQSSHSSSHNMHPNMYHGSRRPMPNSHSTSAMYGSQVSSAGMMMLRQQQRYPQIGHAFDSPQHKQPPQQHQLPPNHAAPQMPNNAVASNGNATKATPNTKRKRNKAKPICSPNGEQISPISKQSIAKLAADKKCSDSSKMNSSVANFKKNGTKSQPGCTKSFVSDKTKLDTVDEDEDKKSDLTEVDTDTETTIMSPPMVGVQAVDDDDDRTMESSAGTIGTDASNEAISKDARCHGSANTTPTKATVNSSKHAEPISVTKKKKLKSGASNSANKASKTNAKQRNRELGTNKSNKKNSNISINNKEKSLDDEFEEEFDEDDDERDDFDDDYEEDEDDVDEDLDDDDDDDDDDDVDDSDVDDDDDDSDETNGNTKSNRRARKRVANSGGGGGGGGGGSAAKKRSTRAGTPTRTLRHRK